MSSTPAFLDLPAEIRLLVYSSYLSAHRHIAQDAQPTNHHLHLLRTSKQIAMEAGPIMWSYVSLLYEGQINAFISRAPPDLFERVVWVDAANDGRLWKTVHGKEHVRLYLSSVSIPSHIIATDGGTSVEIVYCTV